MAADDEVTGKASLTSEDLTLQHAAIVILSADHVVLSCNPGVESLTGYTPEALGRLNLVELFEPAEPLSEVLRRVHAGGSPASVRLRLRTAYGKPLPVEVHCGLLRSLDRGNTRIILVLHEVAPRRVQHHREARPPPLGRLAGGMSHEIRNPMNAIFLHVDIVEEELRQAALGDGTQVAQSLTTIKAELTRLHGLIQDFLALARLSDLQRAPTDLRALAGDLVYDVHPQCAVRGVTLALGRLDDVGEVALHQSAFRRALLNVLQLLIEAVPRDTTLTLSGGRAGCDIQLRIHDSNKTMPPEAWAALRASLRAEIPDPANLQTFVAREIITAHGGEIVVSDDAKAGVLCTITLPLDTTG